MKSIFYLNISESISLNKGLTVNKQLKQELRSISITYSQDPFDFLKSMIKTEKVLTISLN